MRNHTSVARAVAVAACTLAVALLSTGRGVNSTRAGSDLPSVMQAAPTRSEVVQPISTQSIEPNSKLYIRPTVHNNQSVLKFNLHHRDDRAASWRLAQGGLPSLCGPEFTCPAGYSCCKAMTAAACQFQCIPSTPTGVCMHLCD